MRSGLKMSETEETDLSTLPLPKGGRVHGAIEGAVSYDMVSWEEWSEAMKLSGGILCLQVENPTGEFWVRRRGDGMIEGYVPVCRDNLVDLTPNQLQEEVEFPDSHVEPVPKSETPFSNA